MNQTEHDDNRYNPLRQNREIAAFGFNQNLDEFGIGGTGK